MTSRTHGEDECPIYGDQVLLGEEGECTLCGAQPDAPLVELISAREEQAFSNGHASAVHHVELYGKNNVAAQVQ